MRNESTTRQHPPYEALLVLFVSMAIVLGFALPVSRSYLLDFGSFLASGQASLQGQNPYTEEALVSYARARDYVPTTVNFNPPVWLPLFAALSRLSPVFSFKLWMWLSLACYMLMLGVLFRRYPMRPFLLLWSLLPAAVWYCLQLGQVYLVLALLATSAWLAFERRYWLIAGLFVGLLVAAKPNFVVWPLLLLLAGYSLPALVALAIAALLSLVPVIVYGPSIYGMWVQGVVTESGVIAMQHNASIAGVLARFGWPAGAPGIAVALVLAAAWLAWRYKPSILNISSVALATSMLASPVAWVGYTALLVPAFISRPWPKTLLVSAVLLAIPEPLVFLLGEQSLTSRAAFGSIYPVGLFLFTATFAGFILDAGKGQVAVSEQL